VLGAHEKRGTSNNEGVLKSAALRRKDVETKTRKGNFLELEKNQGCG